ncbi:MAG: tetratricopeptide repeat protein [Deltaproteobacteria bacterium]|nr:tetratricopeptide repeat protein [Deltaproteobacteria bacterium]MBW2086031.1 tetratricopeptide repeat protein [Deltaproteobacteria bacterium]
MSELDNVVKDLKRFKILIVDDKPVMRKTIRNMLRVLGFNAFYEAEDGEQGFKKLLAESYDFIICDWNMPRMSGYDLLVQVRQNERLKNLPFLMVTAEVEEGTVAQAIESDVDGYIIKPFVPKILEEKMVEILSRRLEPSEVDTQLQLADILMKANRFDDAHRELDKAEKILPRSPKVHYTRGLIYELEGKMNQAERSFHKAREMGPQFIKAREKLAEVYKKMGKPHKVVEVLKEAVQVSPKHSDRQAELGKALLEIGRAQEAKKAFNKALEVNPVDASLKTEIGEAFLAQGMDEEAENAFKAAIESNPEEVFTYNRLGIAFRRQGKYEEAIENYKQALTIQPDEENLLYNLARAYLEAGNNKQALASIKKALRIQPHFKEAQELLEKMQKS